MPPTLPGASHRLAGVVVALRGSMGRLWTWEDCARRDLVVRVTEDGLSGRYAALKTQPEPGRQCRFRREQQGAERRLLGRIAGWGGRWRRPGASPAGALLHPRGPKRQPRLGAASVSLGVSETPGPCPPSDTGRRGISGPRKLHVEGRDASDSDLRDDSPSRTVQLFKVPCSSDTLSSERTQRKCACLWGCPQKDSTHTGKMDSYWNHTDSPAVSAADSHGLSRQLRHRITRTLPPSPLQTHRLFPPSPLQN
ncbi:hypothetical protein P7K49_026604 [Saguinus oedipus]|uniref:Uncharacterized protein n=1 Tax=Saguinus oedipus TaxID=9490 RepID=A0ABQ9UDM1_SAGOE|nr:hypothetical protein P7K49_026604 [Saguinus oedipus]